MQKKPPAFTSLLAAALPFLLAAAACAEDSIVTPAMAGRWSGNARVTDSWCRQTNLPVALDIHPDGTVSGKVGDARIRAGYIARNRGWLGRTLNVKTDYVVRGTLKGPIIEAEGIARPRIWIYLDAANGIYTGSVETSGTVVGGKPTETLSAAALKLTRAP
jgi:hypothetical protein